MAAGEPEDKAGGAAVASGRRHPKDYPYFGIELFVLVHVLIGGWILVAIWMFERWLPFHGRKDIDSLLLVYTLVWCVVNLVRRRPHWTWHQWLFVAVMLLGWPVFFWSYFARGTVVNFGGIPWEQAAPIFAIAYVVILVVRRRLTGKPVFDHDDPKPSRW